MKPSRAKTRALERDFRRWTREHPVYVGLDEKLDEFTFRQLEFRARITMDHHDKLSPEERQKAIYADR